MIKTYNAFDTAREQFDKIAVFLELDQASKNLLREPIREFHFSIPVRMDDNKVKSSKDSECSITMHWVLQKGEYDFIPRKQ